MQNKLPISKHLHELKIRLSYVMLCFFVSFAIAYFNVESIYQFLLKPLTQQWGEQKRYMIYTNLVEIFFSYLKLSYYVALFITIPFLICQFYLFIAPGLYQHEKKTVFPLLILVPILFFLGAIFVYHIIFPLAWKFFLSFEQVAPLPLKLEAKVSEYLEITIAMVIAFGVAFELPVMLVFLAKLGLITSHDLIKKRRFAIVMIFIVAAILTPPDVISQIGLAIAMLILYELSIIACKKIK